MICQTCGNEIGRATCPYCATVQSSGRTDIQKKVQVRNINLKHGSPDIEQATSHLQREIGLASSAGTSVIRVLHGWGSTGAGGAIAHLVHNELTRLRGAGKIHNFYCGSELSARNQKWLDLLDRFSQLQKTARKDEGNRGITVVVL